ncbi:MAG: AraC family transcriptional regulator ligand-binding domain-containing protein [Flavobacteriales bacterium]
MTFSGRFVLNIIQLASQQGADFSKLLALSGFSANQLCDEDFRVESEVYGRVLDGALSATNDAAFGLHIGEHLSLSAAGLIYQIVQTSSTVEEALQYCCDFANLGCRALPLSLRKTKDEMIVELIPDPIWAQSSATSVHHTADGILAFTLREFQNLTLQKHQPTAVHIPYGTRENRAEYERVFRCPVHYDSEVIAMHFKLAHVQEPIITSDYKLLQILVSHAEEKLQAIEGEVGFTSVVKRSIMNMVKPKFPTIEEVAASLNLSIRSFQRKLKEFGKTYKELLDEVRLDLAKSYLKKPDLTIGEIAYLLDYSEPSAFIRSFKRWTNKTPSQYKQTL